MADRSVSWLRQVNLREEFRREDRDFTPWLAEEENLRNFGDRIGMDLSLVMVEQRDEKSGSGLRSLDILAALPDGTRVAIENQYGEGDHDHLTRGLAYAVNLDCPVLIVVAENHKPEFRAIADYLNRVGENANDAISVFLVRFALLEAPDGTRFPQIEIQAEPNDFRASNTQLIAAEQSNRFSEQQGFWDQLLPKTSELPLFSGSRPTGKSSWVGAATSVPDLTWQLRVRAEHSQMLLYAASASGTYNEGLIEALRAHADEIEAVYGAPLTWDVMEGAKDSKVVATIPNCGYRSSEPDLNALTAAISHFYQAIEPHLSELLEVSGQLTDEIDEEWDGETYVFTLGESEGRTWHDCRRFGFLSAGGDKWYTQSMNRLAPGDRVFCHIPSGTGYVGVGFVSSGPTTMSEATFMRDGEEVSLMEQELEAPNPSGETVVFVDWVTTVGTDEALWAPGMRGNQNTVWKLQHPFTIEQLTRRFGWPDRMAGPGGS